MNPAPATLFSEPLPKARAKTIATVAAQQGTDIAHVRLLGIEAFQVMTDSVKRYLAQFETTSPNLYVTINQQINAACQIEKANARNVTRRQLIARAACLEKFAEAQDDGLNNGLSKEEIKKLRKEAIAGAAAFFGLGNKASQLRKGRKAP